MKIIIMQIIALLPFTSVFPQNSLKRIQNREVIIQKEDTLIRASVLTGKMKGNPELTGTYFWYSKGVINSNAGGYSGKLLHGDYSAYCNDKLVQAGKYNKGLKTGIWTTWYESGVVKKRCNYIDGLLSGEYSTYDKSGIPESVEFFKNGKKKENDQGKRPSTVDTRKNTTDQTDKTKKKEKKNKMKKKDNKTMRIDEKPSKEPGGNENNQ